MKGRVGGGHHLGGAPSDLLVCFPSRADLVRMSKPICSPSRLIDNLRHPSSRPIPNHSRASSLSLSKTVKHMSPEMDGEPMSPKVSGAGQIKVRPKNQPISQGWLSTKEQQCWLEALGLKRAILQFFTAGLRFNMGCFGSTLNCTSDEEEEEEEANSTQSGAIFSKWLTVFDEEGKDSGLKDEDREVFAVIEHVANLTPANALLLMTCGSAQAKEWLEGGEEEEDGGEIMTSAKWLEEREKERMMLMSYAPDFFKLSMDIAKETWVDGVQWIRNNYDQTKTSPYITRPHGSPR